MIVPEREPKMLPAGTGVGLLQRLRAFFTRPDLTQSLQRRIWRWALEVFGETRARDPRERLLHLIEEVAELARAEGVGRSQVQMTVSYVYARPERDLPHRAGGVYLSLMVYAEARGLCLSDEASMEIPHIIDPRSSAARRAALPR
jgi:hypothetical protein